MKKKGVLNNLLFFMGYHNDEEYEDDYDEMDEETTETNNSSDSPYDDISLRLQQQQDRFSNIGNSNVVSINSPGINKGQKVRSYCPSEFNESVKIVDALKKEELVILNIEPLDKELSHKIFDFCSGALYALDGKIQKVSRGIFILAPNKIDLDGDIMDAFKGNDIFNFRK